jgi:hypothetical protein
VLDQRILLSTLIAEIDTGVDLNSAVDAPYYDLPDAYNAYTRQGPNATYSNIADNSLGNGHGHGSTVADSIVQGIQAAKSQPGAAGADVKIMPIRVTSDSGAEDSGVFSAVVRGIFYAAYHHASVINLSIVFYESRDLPSYVPDNPDPSYTNVSPTLGDAIAYAESKGAVVVTGAGNDHYNIDSTDPKLNGYYPQSLFPTALLAPNLLVAGSTDSSGNLTDVSNYGSVHVTLGAPAISNATSYAAGYTSGVSGVIAALGPGLSAGQVAGLVKSTAQVYPQLKGLLATSAVISPSSAVKAVLAPTVAAPATASAATVSGTTTNLSALGASVLGESNLTYSWSVVSGGPVTFSPQGANGTNAGKNLTAAFTQPGDYTFRVTIADGSNHSVTSDVAVTVKAVTSAVSVTPVSAPVANGASQSFAALADDQFGNPLAAQPAFTWSVRPGGVGGTIDRAGRYTAPASGAGIDTIVASVGEVSGSSVVNVGVPAVSLPIRIACGSSVPVGPYQADTGFSGGASYSSPGAVDTSGVAEAAPQAVYRTERWSGGQFSYTIPGLVPGAAYKVRLEFAESMYHDAGSRQFNVTINGTQVLSKFDILSAAGGMNRAVDESFAATADATGTITIQFANVKGGAKCDGIVISPNSTVDVGNLPPITAKSLGQDGHDLANIKNALTPKPGPDGFADVHLSLGQLPSDLPVARVKLSRYGGGGLYTSDGSVWSWSTVVSQASTGPGQYSSTADVYFQPNPYAADNQTEYEVEVFYVGVSTPVITYVHVTDNPQLRVNPAPPPAGPPTVSSLGQDGHDLANIKNALIPAPGPDGYQDVHLVVSNLPANTPVTRVELNRYGGGGLYTSDGSAWSWSTVVAQASTGAGRFSSTADIYFQPNRYLVDQNTQYQVEIFLAGQTTPVEAYVRVSDDPKLRMASQAGSKPSGQIAW